MQNIKSYQASLKIYYFYNAIFLIVLPSLSIGRVLGLIEPAYIMYALNPLIVLLIFAKTYHSIQYLNKINIYLLLVTIFSALIGINYLLDNGNYKEYLSHIFQLGSMYIMFNFGRGFSKFPELEPSPNNSILLAITKYTILSVLIATLITAFFLGRGDVGRYYSPVYALIFPMAVYSVNNSAVPVFLGWFIAIISNKRAVILSLFNMLILRIVTKTKKARIKKSKHIFSQKKIISTLFFSCVFIGIFFYLSNLNSFDKKSETILNGLQRASEITQNRFHTTILSILGEDTYADIDKGRTREIDGAIETLTSIQKWLFGNGAGWSIITTSGPYTSEIQNIHFTPLSLISVYGLHFSLFIYLFSIFVIFKGIKMKNKTFFTSFSLFYIASALTHSIFAYSLFIDLNYFFLLGFLYGKK